MEFDVVTTKEEISGASTKVENVGDGRLCLVMRLKGGIVKRCFIEPEDAVKLYRCFSGETNSAIIQYRTVKERDAVPEKMSAVYLDDGYLWNIKMKDLSFCLNADQALALAWAIKRCVSDSIVSCDESQSKTKEIWLLLSTGVINVPDPHPGEDTVQTRAFVYATREAACDALREFMRPDVNEANSEARLQELGSSVDDELDNVLESGYDEGDSPESDKLWTYDGTIRSYEWRLLRLRVEP